MFSLTPNENSSPIVKRKRSFDETLASLSQRLAEVNASSTKLRNLLLQIKSEADSFMAENFSEDQIRAMISATLFLRYQEQSKWPLSIYDLRRVVGLEELYTLTRYLFDLHDHQNIRERAEVDFLERFLLTNPMGLRSLRPPSMQFVKKVVGYLSPETSTMLAQEAGTSKKCKTFDFQEGMILVMSDKSPLEHFVIRAQSQQTAIVVDLQSHLKTNLSLRGRTCKRIFAGIFSLECMLLEDLNLKDSQQTQHLPQKGPKDIFAINSSSKQATPEDFESLLQASKDFGLEEISHANIIVVTPEEPSYDNQCRNFCFDDWASLVDRVISHRLIQPLLPYFSKRNWNLEIYFYENSKTVEVYNRRGCLRVSL